MTNKLWHIYEHQNCDTPIVAAKEVSESSKTKLRSFKRKEASSAQARDDDFFVIEQINEVKDDKGKKKYLVKSVGYPDSQSTWEPEENVPGFIKQYYENGKNIGSKLPAPTIKTSKTVAGVEYHYLKWGSAKGDWLPDEFFKIIGDDGEIVDTHETVILDVVYFYWCD